LELADRPVNESEPCPPDCKDGNRRPYYSLIPLRELCAELLGLGPSSKKVLAAYHHLIENGGSEFSILMDMSRPDLERLEAPGLSGEILSEAIMKMRAGEVSVKPGYDGEYGRVDLA
jgi:PHP family Zn ribbon phosphoesterase